MTTRRIYFGSLGPFLYEDDAVYPTPDEAEDQGFGDGVTMGAMVTEGSTIAGSVKLFDVDKTNTLELKWYVQEATDRVLNIIMSGGDRSLTILADSIVNQNLATNAVVTHAGLTLNGALNVAGASNLNAAVIMNSSLDVAGTANLNVTIINSTLGVAGTTNLNVTTINSTLGVAGATTLAALSATSCSLGVGELTCGSVNRASGTMTLEIGGAAQISITSTEASFGGTLKFGTHAAIGAETVTGYVTVNDSGGTPRKLAVVS